MARLSIIVPVLDEAPRIRACLERLAPLRARGAELIVADGGSADGTAALAAAGCDRVVTAPRGRALQMNAGAAVAAGDVLLFLHADTALPADADRLVLEALDTGGRVWGRFDVHIAGHPRMLACVAWFMNRRSRWTGIATGDQAIFATRAAFEGAGRYPEIALMEDIALSRALRRASAPACIAARAVTSGRRWEKHGVWKTILLMWRLRLAYFLGGDPAVLARKYHGR